jgi:hypothetical protein
MWCALSNLHLSVPHIIPTSISYAHTVPDNDSFLSFCQTMNSICTRYSRIMKKQHITFACMYFDTAEGAPFPTYACCTY